MMSLQVSLPLKNTLTVKPCTLLKRFEHKNKPQNGWVVHCRSVAPPKCLNRLNLVPFLQYALCLDLELMQLVKKSNEEDLWPLQVASVSYNSSKIFYTDKVRNSEGGGVIVAIVSELKKVK